MLAASRSPARMRRQRAEIMMLTRVISVVVAGLCSRWNCSAMARKASLLSLRRQTARARAPWRTALRALRALPSSVLGPVDFWALRRLAVGFQLFVGNHFDCLPLGGVKP